MTTTFNPEFDFTYRINADGNITEARDEYSPEVSHDPGNDVCVESGWDVLTGFTGQYGYNGAVMHPSEQWGDWAVNALREQASDSDVVFCIVEVRDEDGGFPDGDPIGWAVAYKSLAAK